MEETKLVTEIFLPIGIAFIMLSLGLSLVGADFKRIFYQPKDFMIGAFSQIVILPLVAFAVASAYEMEPELAVGIMILAACPGGVTSNIITHLAKGDTALSVSLTAAISLFSVITLPLVAGFSLSHFMVRAAPDLDVFRIAVGSFGIVAVPTLVGMLLRRFAERAALAIEKVARHISTGLFLVLVMGAFASRWDDLASYIAQSGAATLTLNLVMMSLAYSIAQFAGLGLKQKTAITLECGLQNGTLAIFVALTLIGNTTMAIPGAIYSLIMMTTAGGYLIGAMRREKRALLQA